MVERKFYNSTIVSGGNNGGKFSFVLDYYILEKEVKVESFCINTYGIEITKRNNATDEILEFRKIYDIFCSESETIAVLNKLISNSVTPVSLLDVLEDLIGTGDLVNEEASFKV